MEEIGEVNQYTIYCEPNEVGGHRYWSDSIGGGVCIWDTCLASIEELEFAIKYEKEQHNKRIKQLTQYKIDVSMMVHNSGYFVIDAESPEEALKKYETDVKPKIPETCKDVKVLDVTEHIDGRDDIGEDKEPVIN